jgi:hypothetical protein
MKECKVAQSHFQVEPHATENKQFNVIKQKNYCKGP